MTRILTFATIGRPLALCAALLLSGCSSFMSNEPDPLDGLTAVYSWRAEGNMVFACAYDTQGAYWRFIRPEGSLYDEAGKQQATLLADFGIRARDGSQIAARIVKQKNADSARNLKPALFETSAPAKGMLEGIRFVERRSPEGGMPLAGCSPSQRGKRLTVPFKARYIFYR